MAKVETGYGSLRSCAYRKCLSGLVAIGRLAGDGLSVPGTGVFSISSSAPVARFIARTNTSLLPAFDT
jgi:hypothetical protein